MSKMQSLEQAMKVNSGRLVAESKPATPTPTPASERPTSSRRPGRVNKENISAWLDPAFGTSLRQVLIKLRSDPHAPKQYMNDLIAEALNDLFIKYDVPTVEHK